MTTYITQEQAVVLANQIPYTDSKTAFLQLCNAAIQAYRDSLISEVVLPEPVTMEVYDDEYVLLAHCKDYARQAIADALAKQVPQYLCNGMRFKVANRKGEAMLPCLPDELAGRWVALVAAEDDCHLLAAAPGPKEQQ